MTWYRYVCGVWKCIRAHSWYGNSVVVVVVRESRILYFIYARSISSHRQHTKMAQVLCVRTFFPPATKSQLFDSSLSHHCIRPLGTWLWPFHFAVEFISIRVVLYAAAAAAIEEKSRASIPSIRRRVGFSQATKKEKKKHIRRLFSCWNTGHAVCNKISVLVVCFKCCIGFLPQNILLCFDSRSSSSSSISC